MSLEFRVAPMTVIVMALALMGCATTGYVAQRDRIPAINAEGAVALKGYDAVAYFTDRRPVPGTGGFAYHWHSIDWRFATAEHRDTFAADPEKYAPQYGGYCAFAISRGYIADIEPEDWAIEKGKLYLNNGPLAQRLWEIDRAGNIAAGDSNWPLVPKLTEPPA